jgi:ubiquinone/menaquinone biosynthesis C-methylase UbiE
MPKYQQITQSEPDADKRDSSGWSASLYNKTASFVYSSVNTAAILDLLDARPGERILDVGCGSGELTVMLQGIVEQLPGGVVVGTDFSQSMVRYKAIVDV